VSAPYETSFRWKQAMGSVEPHCKRDYLSPGFGARGVAIMKDLRDEAKGNLEKENTLDRRRGP